MCVCLYVCMRACMYVCMYVFMYVFYVYLHVWHSYNCSRRVTFETNVTLLSNSRKILDANYSQGICKNFNHNCGTSIGSSQDKLYYILFQFLKIQVISISDHGMFYRIHILKPHAISQLFRGIFTVVSSSQFLNRVLFRWSMPNKGSIFDIILL